MEVYVARQPILDRRQQVIAYELLYRGDKRQNQYASPDGDQATADVVLNSFFNMGIDQLTEGKSCFVNFTENLLKSELPLCFPPQQLVIELLETITPTEEMVQIVKLLKGKGYRIALDDYILHEDNPYTYELLLHADIIKIDIRSTTPEQQTVIFEALQGFPVQWLAEKVETYEEYQYCKQRGYDYFQGYFFSKPSIVTSHDVAIPPMQHMNMIQELSKEEPEVRKVASLIETDMSLSYKLLRLINTVANRRVDKIKSIEQAIMLLGFQEVKKWAYVLAMKDMREYRMDFNEEAMKMTFLRAKLCEQIAIELGKKRESSAYFLTGLLSLIELFMQQPLQEILLDLPVDEHIKQALNGEDNEYKRVLDLCMRMEEANWSEMEQNASSIGISMETLFKSYNNSLQWTKQVMQSFYTSA
ncbi:EAL and HDOD domain-containing protein [Pontibacillus salicampi]|uniref:EAL and HDOD domain-containing protein n=1 Tax=Pontibacillus salicampi TaxID=1449801 RepID=A0ABV6LRK1_9BACI